jgi:hypothetical protein
VATRPERRKCSHSWPCGSEYRRSPPFTLYRNKTERSNVVRQLRREAVTLLVSKYALRKLQQRRPQILISLSHDPGHMRLFLPDNNGPALAWCPPFTGRPHGLTLLAGADLCLCRSRFDPHWQLVVYWPTFHHTPSPLAPAQYLRSSAGTLARLPKGHSRRALPAQIVPRSRAGLLFSPCREPWPASVIWKSAYARDRPASVRLRPPLGSRARRFPQPLGSCLPTWCRWRRLSAGRPSSTARRHPAHARSHSERTREEDNGIRRGNVGVASLGGRRPKGKGLSLESRTWVWVLFPEAKGPRAGTAWINTHADRKGSSARGERAVRALFFSFSLSLSGQSCVRACQAHACIVCRGDHKRAASAHARCGRRREKKRASLGKSGRARSRRCRRRRALPIA